MARKSHRTRASGSRRSGKRWIWLAVGIVLTGLMLGDSRAKFWALGFIGVGAWLVGPAVVLLSLLSLAGYEKRFIELWRNRLILSVPILSLAAGSLEGVFTGRCSIGGLVGGFIPIYLANFLGGSSYWICAGIGLWLLHLALVRPLLRKWNVQLPEVSEIIRDVLPSNGGTTEDGGDSASSRSAGSPISFRAPPNAHVSASKSDESLQHNEENFFDVLPEPQPDAPIPMAVLPKSPPASRKPVTQDALSSMQAVIRDAARRLFKIDLVPSSEPVVGMTNVRFSFDKAAGQSVSVTKVLDLADDLSVETDRSPVRIYIDSAINFELPLSEEERQFAPIKSLLAELTPPATDEDDVRYLIGRRQDGRPFELSAHSALHMLVGGATGSGKSVLLHSIIWGLVFRYPPSKVRLALYDHKIEEFGTYQNLPHLWQPVVTNEGGYHRLIENLEKEINRRKLARRDDPEARFTWLIVVMDEFRGLSNDAFVALIAEARSLQIRFVLGTQRAEKSFISTSIKANLPTGISFRVRNQLESRLIIGEPDACNLLSHGDCIVHSPSEMERVQTAWVQKSDLKALRGHLSK